MIAALRVICGIRIDVKGREHIPAGPAIVASNHQSMWETVALYSLLPRASIIFKDELMRVPIYGWWGVKAGNIVIDRKAGAKAIRQLTRDARERLNQGAQIVIFPEGTRSKPGELKPLQSGIAGIYAAVETAVHPVVHNSGEHWLHPGPRKIPGVIRIEFLRPIPPQQDRKAFMTQLTDEMQRGYETLLQEIKPASTTNNATTINERETLGEPS